MEKGFKTKHFNLKNQRYFPGGMFQHFCIFSRKKCPKQYFDISERDDIGLVFEK